jgi:uncharacterized membrane protein YedE/YeeE
MTIDWNNFTPWSSLFGGIVLGVAASLYILVNGRVLGISGILGGLLSAKRGDALWRVAFLLGMFAAPWAYGLISRPELLTHASVGTSLSVIVLAGLLVGLGTRYGSGCTSGHGVCGLSRLSPRSLVATVCFMGAGFATVFLVRHIL